MTVAEYERLKGLVRELGHGDEFEWAQSLPLCPNADEFWTQYSWVVISAGLRNQVAHAVWNRVDEAVKAGRAAIGAFKHNGKASAIEGAWHDRQRLYAAFLAAPDRLAYLQSLPFIGSVTKYHLARDLGLDYAKPDRHLVRIAGRYGLTVEAMCQALVNETGDRIGAVDVVIWRAANLGLV